jgi:hypothetical protein
LDVNVHNIFVYNSQIVETTQISTKRRMRKQVALNPYN